MPTHGLEKVLDARLAAMAESGRLKGKESVIRGIVPRADGRGPRYLIEGEGDRPFLRMNSNGYLGMALRSEVVAAEERAAASYGTGPGAVRFISGTWSPHVALERRLAAFHGRAAAMLFSSAYAAVMGLVPPLITDKTAVISDELNHNCIINAIASGAAGGEAHLQTPRHGRARAPPRSRVQKLRARDHRDRRHLQHARRPRAARPHHGAGTRP